MSVTVDSRHSSEPTRASPAEIDAALGRYAAVVDDWGAFRAALCRPLPTTIWANPTRLDRDRLRALLSEEGVHARALRWHPHGLRLAPEFAPGRHWGLMAGLFQSQEEVAMVPALLLNPQPGERVLDLCAAPGNKTAQMAVAMGHSGTLIANEIKRGRLGALRQTVKRLGLTNVAITRRPGQEFPLRLGPFDRVLVDAPCSGEGTVRKNPHVLAGADGEARAHLVAQQTRMLERALQLVRPGGRVVYATCTFAPEENECVVDSVLTRFRGAVRVRPARVSGFLGAPGLTEWAGRRLDRSLAGALRLWPHLNDTGGFFVAVLERLEGPRHVARTRELPAAEPAALTALAEGFGFPAGWNRGLAAVRFGSRYVHLVSADHQLPADLEPEYLGLPALGVQVRPVKLTTAAAMRFGDRATERAADVDRAQAGAFLRRVPFPLEDVQARTAWEGHVLIRYRGFVIGVGYLRRAPSGPTVASLYPKAWSSLAASP